MLRNITNSLVIFGHLYFINPAKMCNRNVLGIRFGSQAWMGIYIHEINFESYDAWDKRVKKIKGWTKNRPDSFFIFIQKLCVDKKRLKLYEFWKYMYHIKMRANRRHTGAFMGKKLKIRTNRTRTGACEKWTLHHNLKDN